MRGGGRAGREGREKRRRERRGRTSPGGERGLRRKKRRLGGKRERCWQPAGRGCCWDEGQSRGAGPSEVPDAATLAAPFPISWHGGAQIHAASTVCLNPQYQQPPSPVPPALWCTAEELSEPHSPPHPSARCHHPKPQGGAPGAAPAPLSPVLALLTSPGPCSPPRGSHGNGRGATRGHGSRNPAKPPWAWESSGEPGEPGLYRSINQWGMKAPVSIGGDGFAEAA